MCNLLSTNLEMSSSLTIVKKLFKQTNIENCAVSLFADPHKVIFFCFVQLVLRCFVELVLLRFRASAPLKTTWGGCCRCSCPYHSFVNLLPNSFEPHPTSPRTFILQSLVLCKELPAFRNRHNMYLESYVCSFPLSLSNPQLF